MATPRVSPTKATKTTNLIREKVTSLIGENPNKQRTQLLGALVAATLGFVLVGTVGIRSSPVTSDVKSKPTGVRGHGDGESSFSLPWIRGSDPCSESCSLRKGQWVEKWGSPGGGNDDDLSDLLDLSSLQRRAEFAQSDLHSDLKQKYGEYYNIIFLNNNGTESVGTTAFLGADLTTGKESVSRQRYRRKMMMKVLQVQIRIYDEEKDVEGCDCTTGRKVKRERRTESDSGDISFDNWVQDRDDDDGMWPPLPTSLPDSYANFVFSNAGHSSAAAHGNFFDQSYTAVLGQMASPVFETVGINFIARNYAMGSLGSFPQLALCLEAVHGTDADLITWNFGMTDGKANYKHQFFANRRAIHGNRPLLLDIAYGQAASGNLRVAALREVEDSGIPTILLDADMYGQRNAVPKEMLPDMSTLATPEEIDAVPKYLKYYRCGDQIERGDPNCGIRYTGTDNATGDEMLCRDRMYKAWWHPGWKGHALVGNYLAVFFTDLLLEAIEELKVLVDEEVLELHMETASTGDGHDMQHKAKIQILKSLQREEDEDYRRFEASDIDMERFQGNPINSNMTKDLGGNMLFRSRGFCHTGFLPAETRYKGILTNSNHVGSYVNYDYDLGMTRDESNKRNKSETSTMQLTYDPSFRQDKCPRLLNIDFKDYYFVRDLDGDASLTLPNPAERVAYLTDQDDLSGIIIVCIAYGKKYQFDIQWSHIDDGNATLSVNGSPVTGTRNIGQDCSLLKGEGGYHWKPNNDGEFIVTANIHRAKSFLKIQSVIIL